jgi:hypothetical protein
MKLYKLFLVGALVLTVSINPLKAQLYKGEVFTGFSLSQVDGDECYGYERIRGQIGAGVLLSVFDWRYKYFGNSDEATGSMSNWLDIGLEIIYNPKGALRADTLKYNSGSFFGLYDLKLNYVEIPLMIYLTDKSRYTVGIGLSYGRLVGINEKINLVETNTTGGNGRLRWRDGFDGVEGVDVTALRTIDDLTDAGLYDETQNPPTLLIQNSNTYSKNDFSICADFRIRIWDRLHAQLRYQYSLAPIRIRLYEEYKPYLEYKVRQQFNNQISFRLTYILGEDLTRINRIVQEEEKRSRY